MDSHAYENGLGHVFGAETGFLLARNPDTVRAPDAAFISYERLPADADIRRFPEVAPDLAVEVASPNDSAREIREKAEAWLEAGASEVWVMFPQHRTVAVHRTWRGATGYRRDRRTEGWSGVFPGFQVPVARLFG